MVALVLITTIATLACTTVAVMWVVCRLLRVQVSLVSVGVGPKVLTTTRGSTEFVLHLFPLTGFVELPGMNPFQDVWPALPPGQRRITDASRGAQMLLPLLGWLVPVALTVALLGPSLAAHHMRTGVMQLLTGVLGPFDTAAPLIARWAGTIESHGVWHASGILLAKGAALGAFPIANAPVFRAAANLFGMMRSKRAAHFFGLAMLPAIPVAGAWLLALGSFALRG